MVCPNLRFGGAEKNTVNLANEFHYKGFNVSVVLLKKEGDLIKDLNPDIKILVLNKSRSRYAIMAFLKLLKGDGKIVVISMLRESSMMVSLSMLFLKTKPYFIIREACHYESRNLIYKKLITYLYSKADLFISNSESTLSSFNDQGLLNKVPTKVVYNPVLPNKFFQKLDEDIEHKWLDSPEMITLITGGRLEKEKNIDLVIRAFNLLSKNNNNLRLLILGDGSEKEKLQILIQDLNLSDKVEILGFVNFPAIYIKKSDLFVMATINEAFGNLLVESMACGTKVLSKNSGGPVEILKNGKIDFLKPFNSPKELAFEIEEALISPVDTSILIERSKDFRVKKIINEYLEIFKTL